MCDLDEIQSLLAGQPAIFGGADLDVDAELALDSLAEVWLVHLLSKRFGIDEEVLEQLAGQLTSIRAIHHHLTRLTSQKEPL